jgi:hypothetical protein
MELKKNNIKIFIITFVCLFIFGFSLLSPILIFITVAVLKHEIIFTTPYQSLEFRFMISLLTSSCSLVTIILSLNYSKRKKSPLNLTSYLLFLIIPFTSFLVGILFRLIIIKKAIGLDNLSLNYAVPINKLNYFTWGLSSMLIISSLVLFKILFSRK